MRSEESSRREKLLGLYRAFHDRDVPAAGADLSDDFEFHTVTGERLGRTEPYRGREGLQQYFADVAAAWSEIRLEPQRFHERGEEVLVLGRVWARDRGGTLIDRPAGWVWRFRGGRLVYGRAFEDAIEARAAFESGADNA
jgi:ketosteroid isomerase-like protein